MASTTIKDSSKWTIQQSCGPFESTHSGRARARMQLKLIAFTHANNHNVFVSNLFVVVHFRSLTASLSRSHQSNEYSVRTSIIKVLANTNSCRPLINEQYIFSFTIDGVTFVRARTYPPSIISVMWIHGKSKTIQMRIHSRVARDARTTTHTNDQLEIAVLSWLLPSMAWALWRRHVHGSTHSYSSYTLSDAHTSLNEPCACTSLWHWH